MRWLFRNLSALTLSLALAVTIWVVAVTEEDPFEEKPYPNAIPVLIQNLPEGMMIVGNQRPPVTIQIRAPSSVWNTLTDDKIHVYADLSAATSGTLTMPLTVEVDERDARVVSFSPQTIQISLEKIVSREVPVRLDTTGEPATGYETQEPDISPMTAFISGPASSADAVSELVAKIDLTGVKQSIIKVVDLLPLNANGQAVAGVTIEPKSVTVNIPVKQLGGYRDVAVKAVIEGQVAPGYRITNIAISPLTLTLFSSDPTVVANLPGFVETEPIDITGANNDIEVRVAPKLAAGVSLPDAQPILVQISIAAIQNSITIQRDLEIQGLGPGLDASASPSTVDVILAGPLPTLDSLTPESVRVILNLIDLPIGLHQVEPEVIVLPEGVTVQTVLPATIEVLITEAGTPTVSPSGTPPTLPASPTSTLPATRIPTRTPTFGPTNTITVTVSATATP
jgi:YbbR domain-containing protein